MRLLLPCDWCEPPLVVIQVNLVRVSKDYRDWRTVMKRMTIAIGALGVVLAAGSQAAPSIETMQEGEARPASFGLAAMRRDVPAKNHQTADPNAPREWLNEKRQETFQARWGELRAMTS
jgi:hypothetical protein